MFRVSTIPAFTYFYLTDDSNGMTLREEIGSSEREDLLLGWVYAGLLSEMRSAYPRKNQALTFVSFFCEQKLLVLPSSEDFSPCQITDFTGRMFYTLEIFECGE